MTQPFDGSTRPEGSDTEEWRRYLHNSRLKGDLLSTESLACEISAAIEAAVAREREAWEGKTKSYRGGPVYRSVVTLVNSGVLCTADIKKEVLQKRPEATSKEVYNALAYLQRSGKICRVGYGHYVRAKA